MNLSSVSEKFRIFFRLPVRNRLLIKKSIAKSIMRIGIVTITLLIATSVQLLVASPLKSQPVDQVNVQIGLNNETLVQALQKIEAQSPFHFIYRNDEVKSIRNLKVKSSKQTVEDFLNTILAGTSLTYRQVNNQVLIMAEKYGNQNLMVSLISEHKRLEYAPLANIVKGKITNSRGEPLVGVSVTVQGSTIGTSTDENGSYSIDVQAHGTLVFSFVGFATREIAVNGRTSVDLILQESVSSLEQVVVVGYGTQKRSDLTGSIASVSKERLSELPVTNVMQAIQGSVAGVNITQGSSVPGASSSAIVRGAGSLAATTDPYIIVDGAPFVGGSLNDINPSDIASVDILKDVSSTAVYGSRGANGVILITTKRGKSGKASIAYNVYTGVESYSHKVIPMNAAEYVQKFADYKTQAGITNTQVLPNAFEQANFAAGITTDWLNKISRQGLITDHTLSISGGNKDVKYYVSGDYLKESGVIKGYQFHRASIRSNIDANITDYLTAGVDLAITSNNYDGGRASLIAATQTSPYGTYTNSDGSYTIYPMFGELLYTSPMLGLTTTRNDRTKNINANAYAELKPGFIKGLKYRMNVTLNYVPTLYQSYLGRPAGNLIGLAQVRNSETKYWIIDNILTYEKDWGKSHANVTALYSAQQTNFNSDSVSASGFINDVLKFNNLSSATSTAAASYAYQTNGISQMIRLNYTYDSRYLFTATARRDGYSAFGSATNKYGIFPSAAVGWNISNEEFMKNQKLFNNLKLRFSYGLSGNQGIPAYGSISTFSSVASPYNGLSTIGFIANVLGNNDLKWESTYGANLGIDFSIMENKISGSIEGYSTKSKDLLVFRSLPTATGYTKVLDNLGRVANSGIEISLRSENLNIGNFRWETTLNFSSNRNKIIDLYGDGKSDIGNQWFIGKPINVIYDYKLQGIWQIGESSASQDPTAKPGDLKFADVNGSKTITADDKVILGQTAPKWAGGITNTFHYKNFHLNIFVQTVQGVTKNNSMLDFRDLAGRQNLPSGIGYWTATNSSESRPSLVYNNSRLYGYAADASYTRVKDVTLSYVLPKNVLDKIKLGGATFYLSGRNLITWTKWVGWDPEADFDRASNAVATPNSSYPLVRTIIIGANITLR